MSHFLAFSFKNAIACIIYCFSSFGITETMCEAGASRFREPKTVVEEEDLVDKAIPTSTKYKNKWATGITIFNEWQTTREV